MIQYSTVETLHSDELMVVIYSGHRDVELKLADKWIRRGCDFLMDEISQLKELVG